MYCKICDIAISPSDPRTLTVGNFKVHGSCWIRHIRKTAARKEGLEELVVVERLPDKLIIDERTER
jgi:hypothetical protein